MWLRPAITLRHTWLHLRPQLVSLSRRTTIFNRDSNGDSNPHAQPRPEMDRWTRTNRGARPATRRRSAAAARVRGRPSGLKGTTASPQRPPYGQPLTPETTTAPQTPTPRGQTPTAPHPRCAADHRQDSGAPTSTPEVGFRLFHNTMSRRVWLRKAIRNQEAARLRRAARTRYSRSGPCARPPRPATISYIATNRRSCMSLIY